MESSDLNSSYFENREIYRDFYQNYAPPYYLTSRLPQVKSASILDIGHGKGQFLCFLQSSGFTNLHGIEIIPEEVENLKHKGINSTLINGSFDQFSRENNSSFHFVTMMHVLEHLPKNNIIEELKNIRSMLLPDGEFLITVPNAQSNTAAYWAYEDFTHTTLFTAGSLLSVLKSAGFSDIKFIDIQSVEGGHILKKIIRIFFLKIYKAHYYFWNKITDSHTHGPSPDIFSFEIKVICKK